MLSFVQFKVNVRVYTTLNNPEESVRLQAQLDEKRTIVTFGTRKTLILYP